ncbi:sulfurtransferase complex subunit TusB [Alteromonas ponticola]|uniref:Sulfurtransferase complex subunit TusB n=1 Tax=Alteromonas ponticola TaxID=2720613 RepID=A0ABX1R753_9ALTE|nr:sulfurtransferase complex subunit TusB [Alteromonas ponticola]NMH61060.1 sulfurtransferase complex subunit TusB [Alteromonas ponticola]
MLYVIRCSSLAVWQQQALKKLTANDSVVFSEDGVYLLRNGISTNSATLYAVKQDCTARGVKFAQAELINYEQWVELSTHHQHWLNW